MLSGIHMWVEIEDISGEGTDDITGRGIDDFTLVGLEDLTGNIAGKKAINLSILCVFY